MCGISQTSPEIDNLSFKLNLTHQLSRYSNETRISNPQSDVPFLK